MYLVMADGDVQFDTVSGLGSNLYTCENNYSLECVESVLVAEELLQRIPYHDKVKFLKNGGDATTAAVRYARAYTGKKQVYYTGYHGCQSLWVSETPPAKGCIYEHCTKFPNMTLLIQALEAGPEDVAAVVVEPLELDLTCLSTVLMRLRNACSDIGAVLVFDEVITGGRVKDFSVANMCGVYPDISCFGKALGGGYPLGIVATSNLIADMTKGVFLSHTFGGEQSALKRCLEILRLTTNDRLNLAWELGTKFQARVNTLLTGHGRLVGYPTRFVWELPEHVKAMIWQGAYDRGVLLGAAFFPKLSWVQSQYDLVYDAIMGGLADYIKGDQLRGTPPQPAFRRV
jgi:glutamate-1-semialdehyde aminotransferase